MAHPLEDCSHDNDTVPTTIEDVLARPGPTEEPENRALQMSQLERHNVTNRRTAQDCPLMHLSFFGRSPAGREIVKTRLVQNPRDWKEGGHRSTLVKDSYHR